MNTDNDKQVITIRGIPVQVVKKNVKNLHVSVLPPIGRVRITAPLKMKDESIRMAVISRFSWIKKQQVKFQNQERQLIREYVSGESHYFMGKSYRLILETTENKSNVFIKGKTEIVMQVARDLTTEKRGELLTKWYRAQLWEVLHKLVSKWEKKMAIKVNKVGIRHMKTRWGSCNQINKTIWLNLELIKKPSTSIEYVLVHEFCHLKEKKHNDAFLKLMDKNMPKWRMYKNELNKLPLSYEKWSY
jgi:hypothetical protein